jgi:hypothetical protein
MQNLRVYWSEETGYFFKKNEVSHLSGIMVSMTAEGTVFVRRDDNGRIVPVYLYQIGNSEFVEEV